MTEEQNIPPQEPGQVPPTSGNQSWQEVGRQFQALGESLSQAMRSAWENEETQRTLNEMRSGLESMARDVGKAVEDTANSPQGKQIREDAGRAVESLRTAGEQTVQEVRPQLINALQQLNQELQKLVQRLDNPPTKTETSTPPAEPPESHPGPTE